jgi:hypothetical protein
MEALLYRHDWLNEQLLIINLDGVLGLRQKVMPWSFLWPALPRGCLGAPVIGQIISIQTGIYLSEVFRSYISRNTRKAKHISQYHKLLMQYAILF